MLTKIIIALFIAGSFSIAQVNENLQAKYQLAKRYEEAGDLEKAVNIYKQLLAQQPGNIQFFNSLNNAYLKSKDYRSAVDLLNKRIETNPSDVSLYGKLGSVYYLMDEEEKAFQIWDNALKEFSDNPGVYRTIANYAIERRAFEKAIEILNKGKELTPDSWYFSYDLASLYSLTFQFKDAAEEYCDILLHDPKQLNSIESRILSYINKPDALNQTIHVLENRNENSNISYSYLLARLYILSKDFEKALGLYQQIEEATKQPGRELSRFANLLISESEYGYAAMVYQKIIDMNAGKGISSAAKLGLAKALEAQYRAELSEKEPVWKPFYKHQPDNSEKIQKIISAYLEVAELYKNSTVSDEAYLHLARIKFYLQNETILSAKYLNTIINERKFSPFTPEAYEELGNIELYKGSLESAEKYFNYVVEKSGKRIKEMNKAKYKLAQINFYRGDFVKAREMISEILNNLKDNAANDAIELSMLLNTTMNDSTSLLLFASAEFLSAQSKYKEAMEKYHVLASNPQDFLLRAISGFREAGMKLALDDYEGAALLLRKIADEGEKNIYADNALYLLGKLYQFGYNDVTKAMETYEELLEKFPNSLYLDDAREQILKLRNKLS